MQILKSIVILFTLIISVSYAQEELETEYQYSGRHYSISYKLEENLQTIRMHGEILSTVVEDLKGFYHTIDLIRKDVPIKLVLYSGGGFLKNYEKLPKAMKKKCNSEESDCRITTIVPSYAYCASACLNIFMVGDERISGKSSRFGFHQGAALPGAIKIPGFAQRSLRKSGLDRDWLETHRELFSSLEITWMYPRELEGSNMITGLSEAWEY
jgi:ATP-dependent protease ClpP protease subunit